MKKFFMPVLLLGLVFSSCSKDDEITEEKEVVEETPKENSDLEIKDFVWRAMNNIYLYKGEIPELANDYFDTQAELNEYLSGWKTPEDLFYDGLVASNLDQFSWIEKDYEELENYLQGSSKSAGFRYGFAYAPNSDTKVIAYVIYVSLDGPADVAGLKRGDFISHVNGVEMTIDNYQGIFGSDNLELGLSTVQNGALVKKEGSINVSKAVFKEKAIGVEKVFTVDGVKIGYLYLSTFLGEFEIDDVKLNDAFARFKSENIDELIVDLRYNSGGYSEFSSDLASMVTGQFEGKVFTQQVWNDDWLSYWRQEDPEYLFNRFDGEISTGEAINSLNLERVYVIETDRSYSASESFVVGLEPYIDVIHVGLNTGGKYQGSITVYDSETMFSKSNINPKHKYAVQPLIYKYANANGYTDFIGGLTPDIVKEEKIGNLGQLGDLNEPLLARTVQAITGTGGEPAASQKRPGDRTLDLKKLPTEHGRGYFILSNNSLKEHSLLPSEN